MKRNLKVTFLTFLMVGLSAIAFARLSQDEFLSQFVKAGVSYKDGKYEEAALALEGILSNGLHSGNIYYNLGNSYVKDGHLGKAVLNYERAKRLMPRDSDLNANLKYTLTLVKNGNGSDGQDKNFLTVPLEAFQSQLTRSEMIGSLIFLFAILGAFHLASLFFSLSKRVINYVMTVLFCMIVFLTAGFIYKIQIEHNASIIVKDTASYFEPRDNATTHYELHEGMKVSIIDRASPWNKVKRSDGKVGWIKAADLEEI